MSFGIVLPFLPFRLLTLCSAPSPVSFAQLSADLGVLILRRRHDCPTVCRSTRHEDRRVDRPSHTSDASRQGPPARDTTGAAAPQRYSPPGPSRTRRRARRSSRLLPAGLRCLARDLATLFRGQHGWPKMMTEERDVAAGVKCAVYVSLRGHHVRVVGQSIAAAYYDESLTTGESGRPLQRSLNEARISRTRSGERSGWRGRR